MTKKSSKNGVNLGLFGVSEGPKTIKGQVNKMMTGDGRKKFDNLSYDEKVDCLFGCGLSKKKSKK